MSDWGYPAGYGRLDPTVYAASPVTGAANVKGSWLQLVASTPFDACGFMVSLRSGGGVMNILYDIGVGAGGSEIAIAGNLLTQTDAAANDVYDEWRYIPVAIPAGTRLATRAQASLTTKTISDVRINLVAKPFTGYGELSRCTDYGAVTASTRGTNMTPPTSGNGAYVQLTAACNDIKLLMLTLSSNPGQNANYGGTVELAIGAGGSEQTVVPGVPILARVATTATPVGFGGRHPAIIPLSIPAGTRIASRVVGTGTPGTLLVSAIVHGFA